MNKKLCLILLLFLCLWMLPVLLSAQTLTTQLQAEVYQYIASRVTADSSAIFVELPVNGIPYAKNIQNPRFLIDWGKGNNALKGRVMVPVKIFNGQSYHSQIQIIATIKCYEYVCVTNKMCSRHQALSDDDIRFELREITNIYSNPVRSLQECLGKRTRRVIAGNRMLTEDMLEFPPLIERGNAVKIVLRHRNLEIVTTGIARQDGWQGDVIRVRQNSGKHVIQCVVKSSNLVMATM